VDEVAEAVVSAKVSRGSVDVREQPGKRLCVDIDRSSPTARRHGLLVTPQLLHSIADLAQDLHLLRAAPRSCFGSFEAPDDDGWSVPELKRG
jgi:hypothetical protein